jgi:hypothetical protein
MNVLQRLSIHLKLLADSDTASWVMVYAVAALSLSVSMLLINSSNYFSI